MFWAPAPEADWYVIAEIHSTRPARIRPHTAISMSDTVQLPPMKSFTPRVTARLHHRQIHRIEHDDGVLLHPQRGCGIDPVPLPPGGTQPRVDRRRCNRPPGR